MEQKFQLTRTKVLEEKRQIHSQTRNFGSTGVLSGNTNARLSRFVEAMMS